MVFGCDESGQVGFLFVFKLCVLEIGEVVCVVVDFVQVVCNVVDVGFDGVELYVVNGYLFDQFFNFVINDCVDCYLVVILEGCMCFMFEVVDVVCVVIGSGCVGIWLMLYGVINFVLVFEDIEVIYFVFGKVLGECCIVYIYVMDQMGFFNMLVGQQLISEVIRKLLLQWWLVVLEMVLMLDGVLIWVCVEVFIGSGVIDLVGFGQVFIVNLDLVVWLCNDWFFVVVD